MTIEIKVATTQKEVDGAFRLWKENFQEERFLPAFIGFEAVDLMRRGWIEKWIDLQRDGLGFILVAKDEASVVGTLTIEFDSERLQVANLFPEVIDSLRATKRRMAYFGSFAIRKELQASLLLVAMFRKLSEFLEGIEIGVCVVNPCHVNSYTRMGFSERDARDNMPGLQNAKAVLMVATAESANVMGMRRRSSDQIA